MPVSSRPRFSAVIATIASTTLLSATANIADEFAPGLRGAQNRSLADAGAGSGSLSGRFVLSKRYDLSRNPNDEFIVEEHTDEHLTHSCSNYINDGSTVFTRDGKLVVKVASVCDGGGCLNSGRIMSKAEYKYGLFTFSAKVPKCNHIWPAIWLLPEDFTGTSTYGRWPCSGEIDILETVHDQSFGTFNVVAGYGSTLNGCGHPVSCNTCQPNYCTSTTMDPVKEFDRYFVESTDCAAGDNSWEEHTFVMNWQPDELTTWIDPVMSWDAAGNLINVQPKPAPASAGEMPTWRHYHRRSTPTWLAVGDFMQTCFPGQARPDAPFDIGFKIVVNIAVGGYGGAPCMWESAGCADPGVCGGAVGSEIVLSDISVWQRAH